MSSAKSIIKSLEKASSEYDDNTSFIRDLIKRFSSLAENKNVFSFLVKSKFLFSQEHRKVIEELSEIMEELNTVEVEAYVKDFSETSIYSWSNSAISILEDKELEIETLQKTNSELEDTIKDLEESLKKSESIIDKIETELDELINRYS